MSEIAISLLVHEREHGAPSGHPENSSRLSLVEAELREDLRQSMYSSLAVTSHGIDPIVRIHWDSYVESVREACRAGVEYLEPDTFVTKDSF